MAIGTWPGLLNVRIWRLNRPGSQIDVMLDPFVAIKPSQIGRIIEWFLKAGWLEKKGSMKIFDWSKASPIPELTLNRGDNSNTTEL